MSPGDPNLEQLVPLDSAGGQCRVAVGESRPRYVLAPWNFHLKRKLISCQVYLANQRDTVPVVGTERRDRAEQYPTEPILNDQRSYRTLSA